MVVRYLRGSRNDNSIRQRLVHFGVLGALYWRREVHGGERRIAGLPVDLSRARSTTRADFAFLQRKQAQLIFDIIPSAVEVLILEVIRLRYTSAL